MKKVLLALSAVVALLAAPTAVNNVSRLISRNTSYETINAAYQKQALPAQANALESSLPKPSDVRKTITLEDQNTVILRGPVMQDSVARVEHELQAISRKISKDTPILLVLDTPGGDVSAGSDLIDFAKALPQKVHTVTLFAASMGFQIAQGLDTRYIIRNGTLMSHRARMEGLGGQVKGELESRYKMIRRQIDFLDTIASQRMGIDLKTYENKIYNELWVYGYDALDEKVADEQVLVRCGESMKGSFKANFDTLFGPVTVTFSKCPLIKAPEAIELGNIKNEGDRARAEEIVSMSLLDETRFVKEYIVTNRFVEFFK